MRKLVLSLVCCGTLLASVAGRWAMTLAQPPNPPIGPPVEVAVEKLRPRWKVGDRWVIETESQQVQRRETIDKKTPPSKPLTWRFTVQAEEQVAERPCFRVQVQCVDPQVQAPITRLWVDRDSYALRQVQTQHTVAGEVRTMTESYAFPTGQPSPVVVAMLVLLPVDLPVFQQADTKGAKSFEFEAIQGPAGVKAFDELSFAYAIEQSVSGAQPDQVKGLFHEEFSKSFTREPLANVQLNTRHRQVRQLWQANLPWPAYSDNGVTRSRLVRVEPAGDR